MNVTKNNKKLNTAKKPHKDNEDISETITKKKKQKKKNPTSHKKCKVHSTNKQNQNIKIKQNKPQKKPPRKQTKQPKKKAKLKKEQQNGPK